jgi:hypothetical protein
MTGYKVLDFKGMSLAEANTTSGAVVEGIASEIAKCDKLIVIDNVRDIDGLKLRPVVANFTNKAPYQAILTVGNKTNVVVTISSDDIVKVTF